MTILTKRFQIVQNGATAFGNWNDVVRTQLVTGAARSSAPSAPITVACNALGADLVPIDGVRLDIRAPYL